MTIRVLLVDDEAMVRVGLRMVLTAESDIEVVGEGSDGEEAEREGEEGGRVVCRAVWLAADSDAQVRGFRCSLQVGC